MHLLDHDLRDVGEVVEVGVGHSGVHACDELDASVPHVSKNLESSGGISHSLSATPSYATAQTVQAAERQGRIDEDSLLGDHVGVVGVVVVHVFFGLGEP